MTWKNITKNIASEEGTPEAVIRDWLVELGLMTIARPNVVNDQKLVLATYIRAARADLPPRCFTDRTLVMARKHFKFWPAYAELWEFMVQYQKDYPKFDARYFSPNSADSVAQMPQPDLGTYEYQSWAFATRHGAVNNPPGFGDGT